MSDSITIHINGKPHRIDPALAETPLLLFLRNDLALTGARFACGLEQCGACMVLLDGEAMPSCRLPVGEVGTRAVITLEGLGTPDHLHPVQAAFLAEQAAQCGYCTAGMIVAATALLDHNPHPTEQEIRAAMRRNVCRCGSYNRILNAIRRAAEMVATDPEEETTP